MMRRQLTTNTQPQWHCLPRFPFIFSSKTVSPFSSGYLYPLCHRVPANSRLISVATHCSVPSCCFCGEGRYNSPSSSFSRSVSSWRVASSTNETVARFSSLSDSSRKVDQYYKATISKLLSQRKFEELRTVLHDMYHNKDKGRQPKLDVSSIRSIVHRCAELDDQNAGVMAETFVAILIDFHKAGRLEGPKPNLIRLFGLCMKAWDRASHYHPHPHVAGRRTERLLDQIEYLSKHSGDNDLKINAIIYTSAIRVAANQGDVDRAERIFQRMLTDYTTNGNQSAKPDAYSVSNLIHAYSRSDLKDRGEKAEQVLHRSIDLYKQGVMERLPHAFCYTAVIDAYAKDGNGKKAESLLEQMYQEYLNGNNDALPDLVTFNNVLNAWAKSGAEHSGKRAEAILGRMIKLDASHSELSLKPNQISYNIVMNAYAKQGKVVEAEQVLESMYLVYRSGNQDAKPNLSSLSTILSGWRESGMEMAGDRAEALLERLIQLNQDRKLNVLPNVKHYNTVTSTWATRGNPERAMAVFEKMQDDYNKGRSFAMPDNNSFVEILKAWENSGAKDAGERADLLLKSMPRYNLQPDTKTLVAAVRCWINSEEHAEAQQRIQELKEAIDSLRKTSKKR